MELTRQLIGDVQNQRPLDHMLKVSCTAVLSHCLQTVVMLKTGICVSILMAIFPCEPGLADFIGAKDNGSGGDSWSYKTCKAPVNKLYRLDALPVTQPTALKY